MSLMSYDLITLGESMLRLSVAQEHLLVDAPAFAVHIAGSESNVAVATARMGFRACWLSRLTRNSLGTRMVNVLNGYGVDCSHVVWTDEDRIGVYYLEVGAAPRPSRVIYDRKHSAASKMHAATFDVALLQQARVLHLTGITAALSEGCYALLSRVIDVARAHHLHIVFDVNYRALLWSPQECSAKLDPLIRQVSTLILSKRDAEGVFGIQGDAPATLKALRDRFGVAQIALTVGEHGAVALNGDDIFSAPGYTVHMVDRIGAGDSFAAGVISGLLEGDFALGVRYGVAMSALQLTLAGDIFRLERSDVLRLMNAGAGTRLVR